MAIGPRGAHALERANGELTAIDGGRRAQPVLQSDVPARDALERALRDVRGSTIGVVGRQAHAVTAWLRDSGRDAEVLPLPGTAKATRRGGRQAAAKRDVLIAVGCVEHADNPPELLSSLRRILADDGRLVVVIANVTHASVRLAMLQGRYPLQGADGSGRAYPPSPGDVERYLNAAGFVVTAAEPQIDSPEVLHEIGGSMPASVLTMLAQDGDAMTSHLAFVAVPEGASTVRIIHHHLRRLADEQRTTSRGTDSLADRVAELELRVRHWAAETDALAIPGVVSTAALAAVETRVDQIDGREREVRQTMDRLRRAVEGLEERVRNTQQAHERAEASLGGALPALEGIDAQVRVLSGRIDAITADQARRDADLGSIRETIVRRTDEVEALTRRLEQARYRRLLRRLQGVVAECTPAGAAIAVISRGDNDLLALPGRHGWHFPQAEGGVYAGHHPADSKVAIAHLEQLRRRGAGFLVVPRTAMWWLDHYRELTSHLEGRYRRVLDSPHTCVVFDLRRGARSR